MRIKTHPGVILHGELEARGMSANALALALGVPAGRITEIIKGRRGVTTDTAIRLGAFFGNEPQFWLNLQSSHDLAKVEAARGGRIRAQVRLAAQG